ncbi:unnamed protein product [Phytophthora fragariaefolia]|uniref:Unnamed protein product n=1 Tax=Phytophthora fragariaefolia TaxID=1490495 RepID=A0A9W6XHU3_9STRA|nr:unnamed protein product [Phytophthora fragariaefolia]
MVPTATAGLHGPASASDDWQRQQQRRIQDELEQQQRELMELSQQQQQRDLHAQLQQMQAQIQHQQQHALRQHAQADRQAHRTPELRYAPGGLEQARWSNDAAMDPSGRSDMAARPFGAPRQQSRGFLDGGFQRSQPAPMRPAEMPAGTHAYAFGYGERGAPKGGGALFAQEQAPQLAQSHFRARNTDTFTTDDFTASSLYSWGRNPPAAFTGQTDRTASFQVHSAQRYMPQQHQQQQQPYYSDQPSDRMYQEAATRSHPSQFASDVAFLDGVMRHFPTGAGANGAIPTHVPAKSNGVNAEGRNGTFGYAPPLAQYRTQVQTPGDIQVQMGVQQRVTVPPTGTVVVPGVSLASPPMRLVTMRDLLNVDEAANKADKPRGRPRGNQQRAPHKRKAPRKKNPAKRQRIPQQQNEQRLQQPPMNRQSRDLVPSQNVTLAPNEITMVAKSATPMYQAFMESRAARALEQKSSIAGTNPLVPRDQTAQSRVRVPEPQPYVIQACDTVIQACDTRSDQAAGIITEGSAPNEQRRTPSKEEGTLQEAHDRIIANQRETSLVCTSVSEVATNLTSSLDKQALGLLQSNTPANMQTVDVRHTKANGQVHSLSISDNLTDRQFEQQHEPPSNAAKRPVNQDFTGNSTLNKSSRRRRTAELPNTSSVRDKQQEILRVLPASARAPVAHVSSTAIAAASSSAVHELDASHPPRVENRTVVIFCKRDFMRYQAARIWRKYQEQLKKQEEWREVRVAGKRTRYLNSRYADEFRRTAKKPNKRTGNRSRARTEKKAEGTNTRDVSFSSDRRTAADSTASAPTPANGRVEEENSLVKNFGISQATDSVGCGRLVSSGAKPDVKNDRPVTLQGAPDASQQSTHSVPAARAEDAMEIVDDSSVSNELNDSVVNTRVNGKKSTQGMLPDVNLGTTVAEISSNDKINVSGDAVDAVSGDSAITPTVNVSSNGGTHFAAATPNTKTTVADVTPPAGVGSNTTADGHADTTNSEFVDNPNIAITGETLCERIDSSASGALILCQTTEELSNSDGKGGSLTSAELTLARTNASSLSSIKHHYAGTTARNSDGCASGDTPTDLTSKNVAPLDKPSVSNEVTKNNSNASAVGVAQFEVESSSGTTGQS